MAIEIQSFPNKIVPERRAVSLCVFGDLWSIYIYFFPIGIVKHRLTVFLPHSFHLCTCLPSILAKCFGCILWYLLSFRTPTKPKKPEEKQKILGEVWVSVRALVFCFFVFFVFAFFWFSLGLCVFLVFSMVFVFFVCGLDVKADEQSIDKIENWLYFLSVFKISAKYPQNPEGKHIKPMEVHERWANVPQPYLWISSKWACLFIFSWFLHEHVISKQVLAWLLRFVFKPPIHSLCRNNCFENIIFLA